MRVRIIAEIYRDGEREPVRVREAEFPNLTPERAVHLAATKVRPSRAEYQREWQKKRA